MRTSPPAVLSPEDAAIVAEITGRDVADVPALWSSTPPDLRIVVWEQAEARRAAAAQGTKAAGTTQPESHGMDLDLAAAKLGGARLGAPPAKKKNRNGVPASAHAFQQRPTSTAKSAKLTVAEWRAAVPEEMRRLPRWVGHKQKAPRHAVRDVASSSTNPAGWSDFEAAANYYEWTLAEPDAGAGFVLNGDGLVGIDLDLALDANGEPYPWAAALLQPFLDLGGAYCEVSPSGRGLHLICRADLKTSPGRKDFGGVAEGKKRSGVEVYSSKRYLTVSGRIFRGLSMIGDAGELVRGLLEATGLDEKARAREAPAERKGTEPHRAAEVQSALARIDPDVDYQSWVQIGMALQVGLGTAGLALWDAWSSLGAKYAGRGDLLSHWRSFTPGGGITLGTLFRMAQDRGWTGLSPEEEFGAAPAPAADAPIVAGTPTREELFAKLGIAFRRGAHGVAKADHTAENVEKALIHLYGKLLELDNRAGSIVLDNRRLAEGSERNHLAADVARFLGWHEDPPLASLRAGLAGAAGRRSYDPVVRALDGLPPWDGVPRFADLARALSVRGSNEDVEHSADLVQKFLIGAVRRAREPGVKMDNVLVLVGGRGLQKTEGLRTLAQIVPDDGTTPLCVRVSAKLKDKDARLGLQGPWFVELAELATVRAAENDEVKAFLDEHGDWYRPPYGEANVWRPRRVVVCGTTNDPEFLNDPTGARRYWPISVEGDIDLGWIRENRAQLWAEADALAAAGKPHWYAHTPDWLRARHDDAHEEGALDEAVEEIVEQHEAEWRERGYFRTADVLLYLPDRATRGRVWLDRAVANKLRRLEFIKTRPRVGATQKKAWRHPRWDAA